MICELCGRNTVEGFKVKLEGGVVTACRGCADLGEVVREVKPEETKKPRPVRKTVEEPEFKVDVEYDLIDDYGVKVKAARERLGLTQEELGRAVNETHSVVHRIELGRYEPSVEFARRLERRLGVKLLVPHMEAEVPRQITESGEVTLGDMVVVRKRGK
jgi:putative transcription factor